MFRLNLRLLMSDDGNGLGTNQCDFRLSYCHYSDNMFPSHYLCDNLHPVTKSHEKSCPCSNPTKPLLANHLGYTESRVFIVSLLHCILFIILPSYCFMYMYCTWISKLLAIIPFPNMIQSLYNPMTTNDLQHHNKCWLFRPVNCKIELCAQLCVVPIILWSMVQAFSGVLKSIHIVQLIFLIIFLNYAWFQLWNRILVWLFNHLNLSKRTWA